MTLLLVITPISEGTGAQLNRISGTETTSSIQIHTYFDELPVYRQRLTDRRFDLTLFNTTAGQGLQLPEPNDVITKTLVVQEQDETLLSFFFRYPPQNLSISTDRQDTLIIDLIPGNRFTANYRELHSNIGLVSQVSTKTETIANPLTFSLYAEDWQSFIEQFDKTFFLDPPPKLFFPSFPLTSLLPNEDFSPRVGSLRPLEELNQNNWFESLRIIQRNLKSINTEGERKYYAIAHADVLFRLGNIEAARNQFKLLGESYSTDDAGDLAVYAEALIEAQDHDYYTARTKLQKLLMRLNETHPLLPYVHFALAETALATKQYLQMEKLLEMQDVPASLKDIVQLRTADLYFATGEISEAFQIYDSFYGSSLMDGRPYSINGYCTILFNQQSYQESSACFQDLASLLIEDHKAAQAHFLAALSKTRTDSFNDDYSLLFTPIVRRYPDTSSALKAKLKLADSCYFQRLDCAENVENKYRSIADQAKAREITMEALFKEAIVYHLAGNNLTSIELLQQILRNFQSGDLRDQAQTLLLQLLPAELQRLLDEGQDVEAIALAQQNRSLFEKGWLADSLLYQIGLGFERLDMYPEALQLFLYLKKRQRYSDEETLHFSSIRASHALGDHFLVEDLASEYFIRYPEGKYLLDTLFYRIDCRYSVGKIDEALTILPERLPERNDFRFLAATLFFHKSDYARTADILFPSYESGSADLSDDLLYVLAESLYELGKFRQSAVLFNSLVSIDAYQQIARYRIVQLASYLDETSALRSPGTKAIDQAEPDRWHRFATQDLRYKSLISNL